MNRADAAMGDECPCDSCNPLFSDEARMTNVAYLSPNFISSQSHFTAIAAAPNLCFVGGKGELVRIDQDGNVTCTDVMDAQEAGRAFVDAIRQHLQFVAAERQKALIDALDIAKRAILRAAKDTLWCDDAPAETVIDRIDAVLSRHLQPSLDLATPTNGEIVA